MSRLPSRPLGPQALALRILERVEQDRAFARPLLETTLAQAVHLTAAQRALVTRLVRGTLQWQLQLDHFLEHLLPRGLDGTESRIRWILRLGAQAVLHGEGLPVAVAVDAAVHLTREVERSAAAGLVNAVLRRLVRLQRTESLPWPAAQADPVGHLAVAAALPRWLAARWLAEFGPTAALDLGLRLNTPPPLTVRVHPPAEPTEVIRQLAAQGISARPGRHAPDALILGDGAWLGDPDRFAASPLFVQDEASILVGHLVSPAPGWRVLDACAAPGGKAAHLAGLVGPDGEVTARDVGGGRLRQLRALTRRVPLRVEAWDLLEPPTAADLGHFDAVLLDAPCSNLGTLRRHPEAKLRITESAVAAASTRQSCLLTAASRLVRPQGVLVYAVCSQAPEEGWGVVEPFLAGPHGAGFAPESPPRPELFAGLTDERHALRTFPHLHDLDGFFAVRLRRT